MPSEVERIVDRYLRLADRLLPGRIEGFYVVGSTALGAYRSGRSDVDGIAVLDGDLDATAARRLRALHLGAGARSGATALRRAQLAFPGTCNVAFVRAEDLTRPVTAIVPIASHTAHLFALGKAFDVNPVIWKVFAERGIAVRGPDPGELGLDPQPEVLEAWNRQNLAAYWRPWAEALLARSDRRGAAGLRAPRRVHSRWNVAWGVFGPSRIHCTIATGEVIAKEVAGEYVRATFDTEWHPIVDEALRWWRGEPPGDVFPDRASRTRRVAELALMVTDDALAR